MACAQKACSNVRHGISIFSVKSPPGSYPSFQEVLGLDRVVPHANLCPSWIADLRRIIDLYEALKDADGVVHLGAYQAPNLAPDGETFSNNVTATYNVIKVASDLEVAHVVIASSVATYGFLYAYRFWPPDYLPLDEGHPCRL